MRKIILLSLCFSFVFFSVKPALAVTDLNGEILEFNDGKYKLKTEKTKTISRDRYVRIKKKELNEIRRQALLSRALLQRIRDLEKLYKDIRTIIETVNATIVFIKNFLNIDDLDIFDFSAGSDGEFEHVSGVIMAPGFVEFQVDTTDEDTNFDELGIADLAMDIYYNKNLFMIDHLEGDGIDETAYRIINVSSKTAGAKDRLIVPLSDILTNETSFKLFLAPRNPELIKVGDKTNIDIRYYKRPPKNEDGKRVPPIQYSFAEGSAKKIEVAVK